jgi:hypothetical protein
MNVEEQRKQAAEIAQEIAEKVDAYYNVTERDLTTDLAICEAATQGPWYAEAFGGVYAGTREIFRREQGARGYGGGDNSAHRASRIANNNTFAAEARTGWPHAIKRAMAAEAEVERAKAPRSASVRTPSGD